MIIYVTIATFLFLGFFISDKYQDLYYMFSMFILFIFTAFRNINLGGWDAEIYQNFFYQVPTLSEILTYKSEYAFGYTLFNSIVKTIVEDYRVYQVIYCILSFTLLHIVIKKLELRKQERNLFLFVFFCYGFMWDFFVLLRQNIADLIVWISMLIFLNKPFKYYLNIVFSSLWHNTSLINLIILPLIKYFKKINRRKLLIITLLLSAVLLPTSRHIFNNLLNIFILIFGENYIKYALSETSNLNGINPINYLVKCSFVLLFYFMFNKIKNQHKETLFIMSCIALIISSINHEVVQRIAEYFMIGIYVSITILQQAFTGKDKYLYLLGIYYLFIVVLIRFLNTYSGGELLNYSTFLF